MGMGGRVVEGVGWVCIRDEVAGRGPGGGWMGCVLWVFCGGGGLEGGCEEKGRRSIEAGKYK